MKIAILGYGSQGQAAYEYWREGHEITVCDKAAGLAVPDGVETQLGTDYLRDLDRFDLIVRSPGILPQAIAEANPAAPVILDKVTTVTNEFFRVCPTKHIIGVTGTKGKGTTSTLIARMLEADGQRVHLGGNIGIPPLELLRAGIKPEDWVVLELANFQLIDLRYSPPVAVCLMVVPEQLDWHPSVEDYFKSKSQLFRWQTADDVAIYYAENADSRRIAEASPGRKIPYMAAPGAVVQDGKIMINDQDICETGQIKLPGKHNWQNICAAVTAVWQVSQNPEAIREIATNFTGLEHRLQMVRELHGVRYYDDSYGTTPETAMVAVEAFEGPKIVILGGRGKGIPFDKLAKKIAAQPNMKKVIVIGETGDEIAQLLRENGYQDIVDGGNDIVRITELAQQLAAPGDVVLLSTACTSFDMFKNYQERGERFTRAVQALV